MKDLNGYVVNRYAVYWEEIATELDLYSEIENVEEKYSKDKERLRKVLETWHNSNENPTWEQLEVAIYNAKKLKDEDTIGVPGKEH